MSTHPDNHDRRHRRRSLILVALLLLSFLGTVGYLLDLELTPRDLDRQSWWLVIVARAADGSTRVSLGNHTELSGSIAWPELQEGEHVALLVNGWSTERCPRRDHWLFGGLQIEHETSYRPDRLSKAPGDDPSLAFGELERTAAAALVAEVLDDFAIKPQAIVQGARVRRSNVPRIVLRSTLLALIVVPLCASLAPCALIIRDWLREQFERCPRCGYGLRGLPDQAQACPECGDDLAWRGDPDGNRLASARTDQ